ncbi:hypothetical protein ACWD3D_15395, partial [Streptomyces sp. NPDC002690]
MAAATCPTIRSTSASTASPRALTSAVSSGPAGTTGPRSAPAPASSETARCHDCGSSCVLEPVRVGDLVHVRAQVNWTGRSSM